MRIPKYQAIAAAVLTMTLAACGGGGGSDTGTSTQTTSSGQSSTTGSTTTTTQTSGDYQFVGSAPTVTGANGNVSAIFSANALHPNGLIGSAFYSQSQALTGFTQQSAYGGAFTSLNDGAGSIDLTKGSTIADINGTGGFIAIGRWTKGSDTSGGNYTANQGGIYIVGNPLTLTAGTGTLACSAAMSTSPTSISGNTAVGTLKAATATFDKATLMLTNFSATVTIGSDVNATFTKASVSPTGLQTGGGIATMAEPMGNDASKPFIALAYGVNLPNTGDVSGVVVLSCQ
jgi:hypothetical protein